VRGFRKLIFSFLGIAVVTVVVVGLRPTKGPIISARAWGRYTNEQGLGYAFSVTNRSGTNVGVSLKRTSPPLPPPDPNMGYAYSIQTEMRPFSDWNLSLYPPEAGVPWEVELSYRRVPGKMESKLRAIGRSLNLCKGPSSVWETVQTIKIEK